MYTSLRHWVVRGTRTPKDKDEVNRREVFECDGRVCDLEVKGVPSLLRIIRKAAALARARPTLPSEKTLFVVYYESMKRKLIC